MSIPEGTKISVRLEQNLSGEKAEEGQSVQLSVWIGRISRVFCPVPFVLNLPYTAELHKMYSNNRQYLVIQ